MPPVPPAEIDTLASDWPPHPLLDGLPPPPPPPPIQRLQAPLRAVAVLGASRHTQRGDYVFHVRTWADYGGCRLPLAEAAWQQRVVRKFGGCYVRVQRDIDDEARALRALCHAGLADLSTLLPDMRRTLAPVPDERALGHREHCQGGAETFAALEVALQPLCDAGFTLEYEPEFPFTASVRDAAPGRTLKGCVAHAA